MQREIPIFFSTDDRYIPYLDVAVSSLIENASAEYDDRIIVLNTGLQKENIEKVKYHEREGVVIDFVDISHRVETLQAHFKDVYHFSVVNLFLNILPTLVLRYNTPKLMLMLERMKRKAV